MGEAVQSLGHFPLIEELFDDEGFLREFDSWNEDLAIHIAIYDGMGYLTDAHWKVIYYLREQHRSVGGLPSIRFICKATDLSRYQARSLFGGCAQLWRVAGLPYPGEEAKSYF